MLDLTTQQQKPLDLTAPKRSLLASQALDIAGSTSFGRGWESGSLSERVGSLMDEANNMYRSSQEAALSGDSGLAQALHQQAQSLEMQGRDKSIQAQQWAPTTQSFSDINSAGSAVDWMAGSLGQGLRSTMPSIAGGLVGAGLGAAAAPFTLGVINPATGARIGSALGAAIPGYNMEANETIAAGMMDPGVRANKSMQEIKDTGRVKGAVAGALEAVVPTMVVGKAAGLAGRVAKGDRLAAIGKSAGQGALTEFATEGAQDISGQIAENSLKDQALSDIDPKQAFNAAMAGAVAGGGMGAMGGAAQVATGALGDGKDVVKDPLATAAHTLGRKAGDAQQSELIQQSHEALRILDDPKSSLEERRAAAQRYNIYMQQNPLATQEEKDNAAKYANTPDAYADNLYTTRREKEQNDAHDAIINELNGGKKKSLMRGTLTDDFGEQEGRDSLDDIVTDDQGNVVLGEHGHSMKREVKDGYGGATMITAQPGATQPVPGNEVSAPNTTLAKKTRAEKVASAKQAVSGYTAIDKAAAAEIGTFHQPKQRGVKSQNTERLADAAEIWRKQGIADKLISATSSVTDAKQREMSMAMLKYVSEGLKGDDGNVFVPESLVEVYGSKAGTMINSAAQIAVVKGLADPSILNDAKHAQKIADDMHKQNKDEFGAVRDNMLDAAKKIYSDKDVAKFVPEMRRMAQEGTTKSEEAFLMRLYGNEKKIAAAMSKFKEKTKKPKQAEATARADDGYDGEENQDLDYEDRMASANKGSHDSGYAFRGRGKDPKHENYNAPFDLENQYHVKDLSEALGGTDDFSEKNGVVGVHDALRESLEGDLLREAENDLLDKYGFDFLSDSQKVAMEEYGDGLPVSELVNEMPPQARRSFLNKINKRFVMYSPAKTDSAAAADKVESVSALEASFDPRTESGTVTKGALYLEKVGAKTPFKTTVMDILRHTNKANKIENPHGVSKGVGAHESMQALMQGLSALFETGKFTGRVGYKTEITKADKKDPFASVKWISGDQNVGNNNATKNERNRSLYTSLIDKLPGDLKLGARTLADARKAESEALASGDGKASHKYQPEFAGTTADIRTALEKVAKKIEEEINAVVTEATKESGFKAAKNARKKTNGRIAHDLQSLMPVDMPLFFTQINEKTGREVGRDVLTELRSVIASPDQKQLNKVYTALRNSWLSTGAALQGGGSTIGTTPISQRRKQARPLIEAAKFAAAHEPGQMPKDTTVDPNNVTGDHKRNRKYGRTDADGFINEAEDITASEGDATRDVQEHAGSIRDADPLTEIHRTSRGAIAGDDTNPGMVEGNSRGGDRLPAGTTARSPNDSQSQAMHPKDDKRQKAANVKLGAAQLADDAAVTHLRQGVPHAVKVGADMSNATDEKSRSALVAYTQALNRIAHSTAKQISKDFAHFLTNSGKEMTDGFARSIIQRAKNTLEGLSGKEIEGVVGLTKGDGRSVEKRDTEGSAGAKVADSQRNVPTTKLGDAKPSQEEKVTLPGNSKYTAKDQAKSDKANKFIGRGSAQSSTAAYAAAWGDRANTGEYSSSDTVFVSAEGNRAGRVDPDLGEIKKAIEVGATLITDDQQNRARPYNKGERQVAEFLEKNGYKESTPGVWGPAKNGVQAEQGNRLIEGFEAEFGSTNREKVSALINELKSLLDDTEIGPFGRHRFTYNKTNQSPAELAQFLEYLSGIERNLNMTPKQEKAVSEMLTKAYRAFEQWAGKHVAEAVDEKPVREGKVVPMNYVDGISAGGVVHNMRPEFKGKTTLDLIRSGDRTASTRNSKPDLSVGDNVTFTGKNGEKVKAVITKAPYRLKWFGDTRDVANAEKWSQLEGWSPELFKHYAEKGGWQFQYRLENSATTTVKSADKPPVLGKLSEEGVQPDFADDRRGVATNASINAAKKRAEKAAAEKASQEWDSMSRSEKREAMKKRGFWTDAEIEDILGQAPKLGKYDVENDVATIDGKKVENGDYAAHEAMVAWIEDAPNAWTAAERWDQATDALKEAGADVDTGMLDSALETHLPKSAEDAIVIPQNKELEAEWREKYDADDVDTAERIDILEAVHEINAEFKDRQGTLFNKQNAKASKGFSKEDAEAAKQEVLKSVGPDTEVIFRESFPDGSSGSFTPGEQSDLIEVSLLSDVTGTLAHEAFHKFFKLLRKHGGETTQNMLERVAKNPIVMRQLEVLLHEHPEAWGQAKSNPEEAAAFMYQFWAKGLLKLGPQSTNFFGTIKNFLMRTFGRISKEMKDEIMAEKVMRAFKQGEFADTTVREAAIAALSKKMEDHNTALQATGKGWSTFVRTVGRAVMSAEGVLTAANNPYLIKISKLFNQSAGAAMSKIGDFRGSFFDAYPAAHAYYQNKFDNIIDGLKREELDIVRKMLATGRDSHVEHIQKAVEGIREFNKQMAKYITSRNIMRVNDKGQWEPVKPRDDFGMPQIWDKEKVLENRDEVIKLLIERHPKELQAIAREANGELSSEKGMGLAAKRAKDDNTIVSPEMVAEAIVDRIIESGKVDSSENASNLGISPFSASVNRRSLDWIDNSIFDQYKEQDLINAYTTYIANMTKRGEYTVRFGHDGKVLRDLMEQAHAFMLGGDELLNKAQSELPEALELWRTAGRDSGHSEPTLVGVARGIHKRENPDTYEADLDKAMKSMGVYEKAVMGMEGTLGRDISNASRNINSALVTYQSVRLLSASLFTSFNDIVGITLNGGTLQDAWDAFVTGIREVKLSAVNDTKSRDSRAKQAELWGTVEALSYNDVLGQAYQSMYMSGKFKTFSDKFFRRIGMEGWNRGMRIAATAVGERIIQNWAKNGVDVKDKAEVARFERLFGEGANPEDIVLNSDGTLDMNDIHNRAAMARFVNDAVLRPNAAHRTIWGSDPNFAALWQLKSYTYSFHKVILEAVLKQAALGNYRPAMVAMVGYAPVAIAAGALKEMLIPGDEPPWMKSGLDGYLSYGFDRANLLGVPQMYAGALNPLGKGFDPANLFGPTVDEIQGFASIPFLQDKSLLGETAGALPLGNFARRAIGG